MIMLAAKIPTPDTALFTKAAAAKNSPSWRRPVFSSESSTTSAIIEVNRMDPTIPSPTDRMFMAKISGNNVGEPFAGKISNSRSTIGATASPRAVGIRIMAAGFLSKRWAMRGATVKANTAAARLEKVKPAIWAAENSQKKVEKYRLIENPRPVPIA